MDDPFIVIEHLVAAVRDWATFLAALIAAGYGWSITRHLRRQTRVHFEGAVKPVGDQVFEIMLRARNQTVHDILVSRIAIRRPRPAVLAMDGVYEPGPGPIDCRLVIPAFARGGFVLILGSPPQQLRLVRLSITYSNHLSGVRWTRRASVRIDPGATLLTDG